MHKRFLPSLALVVLATAACADSGRDVSSAALDTEAQRASYGIGLNMGQNLAPAEGRLDMDAFLRGVQDAMAGSEPALDPTEIQAALTAFSQSINEEMMAEREAQAEKNRTDGAAFLAENQAREGVQVTESGLQYEVLEEGTGARPTANDQVRIHYRGTLVDGTEFDSSGEEPAQFGVGGVIPGFAEALQLMNEGSKYRVVIPSDIAYGPQGSGQMIGPDAVLVFEIELLEVI